MSFYYNITTGQVEQDDDNRSRNADVMGPYATEEEARNALATARAVEAFGAVVDKSYEGIRITAPDGATAVVTDLQELLP